MKHLIKQYYHFFCEAIRYEKVFPISLDCFYQSNDLTHFRLFPEFPIPNKNQQRSYFCWFFFASYTLKNQHAK